MSRIIFKCRYLKNAAEHLKNLVVYVATREGVGKIPPRSRTLPAAKKQQRLIADILERFSDAADLFEYEDYLKHPTVENASAFISAALDQNLDQLVRQELCQLHRHPPARKSWGRTAVFHDDAPLVLSKVAEEVGGHTGNVWTPIISLQREDAARLGYDKAAAWMALLRKQRNMFAEQMKITPENLRWYAAFHNEGRHPHCHMIVYSVNPREGYVTKPAIEKMRSGLARDIFQQDLLQIFPGRPCGRNTLTQSHDALRESWRRDLESCENTVIENCLSRLTTAQAHYRKKQYGYLKRR